MAALIRRPLMGARSIVSCPSIEIPPIPARAYRRRAGITGFRKRERR
jgi:hypothetical protein